MRLRVLISATALTALLAAGCGGEDEETPAACLASGDAYVQALQAAPDEVTLEGTPISECLVPGQSGGELSTAGEGMVAAATELNQAALQDPTGDASIQLGYLIGAVERGAEDTGGIHADLIRRLNAAARFSPGGGLLPASFERTFGRGYASGREGG